MPPAFSPPHSHSTLHASPRCPLSLLLLLPHLLFLPPLVDIQPTPNALIHHLPPRFELQLPHLRDEIIEVALLKKLDRSRITLDTLRFVDFASMAHLGGRVDPFSLDDARLRGFGFSEIAGLHHDVEMGVLVEGVTAEVEGFGYVAHGLVLEELCCGRSVLCRAGESDLVFGSAFYGKRNESLVSSSP